MKDRSPNSRSAHDRAPVMAQWKIVAVVTAAVLVIGLSPVAWRAAALAFVKSKARHTFGKLSPESRTNLNAIPARVALPRFDADERPTDVVEIGTYTIRVPRALARQSKGKLVVLTYPRYRATLRPPFSLAASDAAARQLQFQDTFDQFSAVYHTRLDDLDTQPDLRSVRRFLLLISVKGDAMRCAEEFKCADLRGFILASIGGSRRAVADIFVPSIHAGCGIHFEDEGGLTLTDVHDFLSSLRLDARQPPATQAATRASASVHGFSLARRPLHSGRPFRRMPAWPRDCSNRETYSTCSGSTGARRW